MEPQIIEIEMVMHGRPQKPVRIEKGGKPPCDKAGFALRPCCICGQSMTLMCPDCEIYLCCQASCERKHLEKCTPVKRDALTFERS